MRTFNYWGPSVFIELNYVWLSYGSGLGLGSSLSCKWAWALTQALRTYWTRGASILLSILRLSA